MVEGELVDIDDESVVIAWGSLDGVIAVFAAMIVFYSMKKTLKRMFGSKTVGNKKQV